MIQTIHKYPPMKVIILRTRIDSQNWNKGYVSEFFLKDSIQTKVTANTGKVSDINKFSGVDNNLKFLWEECRNKHKIINILLENLFKREITNVSYKDNSVKFLLSKKSETKFRNHKLPTKINNPGTEN